MQGGPRRGRSPITGPTLPHAAQASQTSPEGEILCPKGSKNQKSTPPGGQISAPRRRPKLRREGETPCPKGSKNKKVELAAPRRRPGLRRRAKPRARRAVKIRRALRLAVKSPRRAGRTTPPPSLHGSKIYRATGMYTSKGMEGFQSAGYSSKQGACSLSFHSVCAASHVWYRNM